MEVMTQDLMDALIELHLEWKPSSLKCLSSGDSGLQDFSVAQGAACLSNKEVTALEALGTVLDREGSNKLAIDYRLAKANSKFWANEAIFTDKSLPLRTRFENFLEIIVKSATFASGGWTWDAGLYTKLRVWESGYLRRILAGGRKPSETYVEQIQRTTRLARKLYTSYGLESIATVIMKNIFRMAGALKHSAAADAHENTMSMKSKLFLPVAMQHNAVV